MSYNNGIVKFNLVWVVISVVMIGNIFLFSFLSKNVTSYVSSIEQKRIEQYSFYDD